MADNITDDRHPNWSGIDTVLLDMDGTLLDLNFDNVFWREVVPRRFGELNGLSFQDAKEQLEPQFQAREGSLEWYCLDFWSDTLGLDVPALKRQHRHLVRYLPGVPEFLRAVRQRGKRLVLVTNSNRETLEIKIDCTGLDAHFDAVFSSQDFGLPKEHPGFWPRLHEAEPFSPERTLLVDDTLPVLLAARDFGVRHLIAVRSPDSRGPRRRVSDFAWVDVIAELGPGLGPARGGT